MSERATIRDLSDGDRLSIGGWSTIPSSFVAEVMGRAGFDWVCLDAQHGLMGYHETLTMLQALAITGTPALVRVASNEYDLIGRVLDAGANGVIVPMVNTAEEARRAVEACRYPPVGLRSWGPLRPAMGVAGYSPAIGNDRTLCCVMIETRQAVDAADEILSVEGVDAVWVGPNDLSISYGKAPAAGLADPEMRVHLEAIVAACQRHHVWAGLHCPDLAATFTWREAGFRWFTVGADVGFLRQGATGVVAGFNRVAVAAPAEGDAL